MSRPITVPRAVVLPSGPSSIRAGEAYARCGISRQVAHVWRRSGFPPSDQHNEIETASLARWLVERGAWVNWI